MTNQSNDIKNPMKRARGHGSAGHGTGHWWLQRLTALALVPLSIWFLCGLLSAALFPTPEMVADWLGSPFNALLLTLMVIALFMHAKLGVQVVIEDYVHNQHWKFKLLIANIFLCILGATACIMSILRLHLLDGVGGI